MISSYEELSCCAEVIRMEEQDDFYESFENDLDDDEISPEEEGFIKGFMDDMFSEE